MQTPAGPEVASLTAEGWAFMLCSLAFVWGLCLWCFWRVLTAPKNPSE